MRTVQHFVIALLATIVIEQWDCAVSAAPAQNPSIAEVHIGFANHYKLGFWTPVVVDVANAGSTDGLRIDVTALDSDGVETTAGANLEQSADDNRLRSAVLYTLVGRVGSPVRVSLSANGQLLDERTLRPTSQQMENAIVPSPATSEFILSLGFVPNALKETFPDRSESGGQPGRTTIELSSVEQLPNEWFGYDSVDVLVLTVGDGTVCRRLAGDKAKLSALQTWVEYGGRLVVLCGGEHADEMLAPNGPLSAFAPGKFAGVVSFRGTGALQHFASSTAAIANAAIPVPRFTDVTGKVELFSDLPVVIRTPRGFGEITFVAIEFDQPPLDAWAGRSAFLHALLAPYISEAGTTDASQRLATSGFNDLSGALRQQLGRSFPSIKAIGFPAVAGLAIVYLAFLGPLDYLIIHRWLRRPLAAWITFPIIVLAFSLLALAVDNKSRGSAGAQVNRLQLIDFDKSSGRVRGTTWAVLFSPESRQFDPKLKLPAEMELLPDVTRLFSWWGLPGTGIGGMQTGGSDLGIFQKGYRLGSRRDSLEGVPVLTSATKSLLGRWTGSSPAKISIDLTDMDGLATGSLTNETGMTLKDARLLYGTWAYRLGTLKAGQRIDIGEELSPRRAKTIVVRDALGESGVTTGQVEGRVFAAEQASAADILDLMMFYETAGGYGFAHVPNRYQSFIDMSRQLELGNAVLVGESPAANMTMVDDEAGEATGSDTSATSTTVYRFVLPVKRQTP